MADTDDNNTRLPSEERGSSGMGTLVGVGTAIASGIGVIALLAAIHVAAPIAMIVGGGLAVAGSGMLMWQDHKEKVNNEQAHLTHAGDRVANAQYHKEPDRAKDESLMHAIKGASDLPERVKFVEDHYKVKPKSVNAYRAEHLPMGLGIGVVTGLAAGAAVTAIAAPFLVAGGAALALGGVMGTLAGGTALALHSADVMNNYGKYIDKIAQTEGDKAAQKAAQQKTAPEYDNGQGRNSSHAADVRARRAAQREQLAQR